MQTEREARVESLLQQWQTLCEQGQVLPAEELCADCPELKAELEQRIASLDETQTVSARALREDEKPTDDDLIFAVGQFGRFRFHAQGGLGEVFIAGDEELNREVALKFIRRSHEQNRDFVNQFKLEAEVSARLEHPGIVPMYGLGQTSDGRPFQVMRFIRGETLGDAINAYHAASQADDDRAEVEVRFRSLLGRFVSVCNTIAYAHSRGIVHRDVKPHNIMLGKYGETLVVDWGLALPIERDETARASGEATIRPGSTDATDSGGPAGTPSYMSPEQAAGEAVGPSSDVYSLGATLYRLLTGETPFQGSSVAEIMHKVRHGLFPPPRTVRHDVPRALEAVCLKAMQRDPADRYGSALDMAQDVECWLADQPVSAYRERWSDRVRRWGRRHRAGVVSGTAALAVLLVGAVVATGLLAKSAHEEHVARKEAEAARQETKAKAEETVQMASRFAAAAVASGIDRRLLVLRSKARSEELQRLLAQIADAERGTEQWLEIQHELQDWLNAAANNNTAFGDAAQAHGIWFLTDAEGTQVARVPPSPPQRPSIGRSYSYRDYFHGEGRDFDPEDQTKREPIEQPHRSIVFQNYADKQINVALSVPVWSEVVGSEKVLGVLVTTVRPGDFVTLNVDVGADQRAALVESRLDWEGRRGRILHHPRIESDQVAFLPAPLIERLLAHEPGESQSLLRDYQDPLDGDERWLAAYEPVVLRGGHGIGETGWFVLVQQQSLDAPGR